MSLFKTFEHFPLIFIDLQAHHNLHINSLFKHGLLCLHTHTGPFLPLLVFYCHDFQCPPLLVLSVEVLPIHNE
jgi:hypothetical protein